MSIDLMPGFGAFTPTVVASGSTWNSADISGVTLSNGDRDATGGAWGSVRGTTSKTTEKVHFEVEVMAAGTSIGIGFANSTQSIINGSGYIGDSLDGISFYSDTGNVLINAANQGTLVTWTVGDVIAVEADFTAELVWFAKNAGNWNNNGSADPATGTGGTSFASLNAGPWFIATSVFNSASLRIRTASGAFTRGISSGFSAWG